MHCKQRCSGTTKKWVNIELGDIHTGEKKIPNISFFLYVECLL